MRFIRSRSGTASRLPDSGRDTPFPAPLGVASLLVVLLSVTLFSLSVLALSSAQSDLASAQRLAERRTAEYAAESEAAEFYARVRTLLNPDDTCSETAPENPSAGPSSVALSALLAEGRSSLENGVLTREFEIDGGQVLVVKLSVPAAGENPEILAWQRENRSTRAEAVMPVWDVEGEGR